jgi:hypothetical protein
MVVEAGTTDSQRAAETCDSHNPICMSIEDNKKLMKINIDGNGAMVKVQVAIGSTRQSF